VAAYRNLGQILLLQGAPEKAEAYFRVAAGPNMSNFSRFQNAQLIEAKFATEELRHDV